MISRRTALPKKAPATKPASRKNRIASLFRLKDRQEPSPVLPFAENSAGKSASRYAKDVAYKPVKTKEVALFTRQLAATLSSGILLTEALDTISDELDANFRQIVQKVVHDIRGGLNFSDALAKHPKVFSVPYRSIIEAGEATGGLDKVLNQLAQYLENSEKLKAKVVTALTYPLFLFAFSLLMIIGVVVFIIPKFEEMFKMSGVALPVMTRMVIDASHFFLSYWYVMVIVAIAALLFLIAALRVYAVRYVFDSFTLKVPIFGKGIIHKFLISRYCGTLSTLLSGGVPLSKSLQIVSRVVDHLVMQKAIEKVLFKVVGGAMIADVMRTQPIFTRLSVKMVSVGEKTGRLPEMLKRTADYYDDEMDNLIQKLSVLIEPFMIAVVGIFISFIVVSLYLPIFNIVKLVK